MRILWLCNVVTSDIAKALNLPLPNCGGWLEGAAQALREERQIQLKICFPQSVSPELLQGETGGIGYYGFPASLNKEYAYDPNLECWFAKILELAQPDIVHIWGTEFPQTLAMTKAFEKPSRTVINIQGLCSFITRHYMSFLPEKDCRRWTIRDFLRQDRIIDQRKKFYKRGLLEKTALQNAGYVIGRTRWDRACARQLAPQADYRFCNETLRSVFYEKAGNWTVEECEEHSIFVSQASYPLKGFHMALEAMPEILRRYPNATLCTTGTDPFTVPFYRIGGYQRCIKKLIERLQLRDKVVFLGRLDAEAMCERFLRSHVFVSPSSIENSPNSVGEAMMLGVPTVASYVGGTMDLFRDGEEGFLYQADAPYMLADRVCAVFEDDEMAAQMGSAASRHALQTHDPKKNLQCLITIYKEIYGR